MYASPKLASNFVARVKCAIASSHWDSCRAISPRIYSAPHSVDRSAALSEIPASRVRRSAHCHPDAKAAAFRASNEYWAHRDALRVSFHIHAGRHPTFLHLQGFCIKLVRGHRAWRVASQVLCDARRKIGIRMHQDKKHLRILWELMSPRHAQIKSRVAIIQPQRASQNQARQLFFVAPRALANLPPAFNAGTASLQRPCSARRMAFSAVRDESLPDPGVFLAV